MADSADEDRTGDGDSETADDEWQFSVAEFEDQEPGEEVFDDPETVVEADAVDSEAAPEKDDAAAEMPTREPLEPGDINPENAFFVLLGVALVVGLVLGAIVGL